MDETLQQEEQESEYVNPNEDKGGIGRRLRDRDLLRKRKAEAEEKETNQVESPRKRSRAAGDRSGTKKRGRPRKNEATAEISIMPEEAAMPQEAPAVVVAPEPAEVIPDQILAAVEVQPVPVLAAPAPAPQLVFGSLKNPLFTPAPFIPTLFSPPVPAPAPAKDLDKAPIPVQDVAPASAPDDFPVPTSIQAPDPDEAPAPPTAPRQVGALYVAAQGREASNQVLIEDLAPLKEEDIPPSQDKRVDEDLNGTPLINVPEQNKMFSVPTLSSTPPTQEYLPGNSY